jgi:hypothetical protein
MWKKFIDTKKNMTLEQYKHIIYDYGYRNEMIDHIPIINTCVDKNIICLDCMLKGIIKYYGKIDKRTIQYVSTRSLLSGNMASVECLRMNGCSIEFLENEREIVNMTFPHYYNDTTQRITKEFIQYFIEHGANAKFFTWKIIKKLGITDPEILRYLSDQISKID